MVQEAVKSGSSIPAAPAFRAGFPSLPGWIESLIISAINNYIPPDVVAGYIAQVRDMFLDKLAALAKSTSNPLDDVIVEDIREALTTCSPDKQFLCELVQKGELAFVDLLASLAKGTSTKIDDALVAILRKAMFPNG